MKSCILTLLLFNLVISCCYSQEIKNGGFEARQDNWEKGGDEGYQFTVQNSVTHDGRYAAKLQKTGDARAGIFTQKISFASTGKLTKVIFSGYIKTDKINKGFATLHIRVFDANGIQLSYVNNSSYAIRETTDWKKVEVQVPVSALAAKIELGGLMSGDGAAYFDDLQLTAVSLGHVQRSEVAKAYLDTALNIIERNSFKKDSVDFKYLRQVAASITENAQTPADCYFAISTVLKALNDKHSFFQTPQEAKALTSEDEKIDEWPSGRLIGKTIGYVKVPGFEHINQKLETAWADSLQSIIRLVDNKDVTAWIVDVRDNRGGNIFPMRAGVGPILGDGAANYAIGPNGKRDSSGYRNGTAFSNNGDVLLRVTKPYKLLKPNPKVAVLVNRNVASSGEGLVLAFIGRPATKVFGEPTYGLTTGNEDFTLSDGAMIFVAAVVGLDRTGKKYGGKIIPDFTVVDKDNTSVDEVVEAAVTWINTIK